MKILCLLIIGLVLLFFADTAVAEDSGEWFTAENVDCLLWNSNPDDDQKVRWGGACKDGKAHGDGVAEWYSYQRPADRCECSFVAGKAEGSGIYRWADGAVYAGAFKAGIIEGEGFIKYPDNEMYEGEFKNGYPHGWGTQMLPDGTRVMGKFKDGGYVPSD
ncbi:MAG: hypothetical protein VW709_11045 [Rickettsiales bacterium]|jgi:hypothetical protein